MPPSSWWMPEALHLVAAPRNSRGMEPDFPGSSSIRISSRKKKKHDMLTEVEYLNFKIVDLISNQG